MVDTQKLILSDLDDLLADILARDSAALDDILARWRAGLDQPLADILARESAILDQLLDNLAPDIDFDALLEANRTSEDSNTGEKQAGGHP